MKTLEFYFDFASPMAYLAYYRLLDLSARVSFKLDYKPMLLGAVHKGTGNTPPGLVPAKGSFMLKDIERHSSFYNIPFRFNPHFPVNCMSALRGAVFLQGEKLEDQQLQSYLAKMFNAVWRDELNLSDPAVFEQCLVDCGFDTQHILSGITEPAIKDKLKQNTEEAIARGVFGAPTFFIDDEMYFGQDRLDFVERALKV